MSHRVPNDQLFARGRESWPLESVTIETIEEWFATRKEPPTTVQSNAGILAALFSFAVRRQWIERNPTHLLEKVRIDRKPPQILTPLQCALVLDWARRRKPSQLAFYTLALLAGIRPDELSRLTWDKVTFEPDGPVIVVVDESVSKVRRRRIVELEPTAAQWMAFARQKGGRLPVPTATRRRWLGQACTVLNFPAWPQDILRHTAASMLLARHKDAGRVANTLGNSARILETHYKALVNSTDCAAFWSFSPESPRPVKPKPVRTPLAIPQSMNISIDMALPLFARAEAALQYEPWLRMMGKRWKHRQGQSVDTIRELGRIAGCSRQTMQFVRVICQHADPDVLDRLRKGKLRVATGYRMLIGKTSPSTS